MRFGLFGSASVQRGEHPGRVGEGFFDFVKRNIEAEQLWSTGRFRRPWQ